MDKDVDPRLLKKRFHLILPGGMYFEFDFRKIVDGVRVPAGQIREVIKKQPDQNLHPVSIPIYNPNEGRVEKNNNTSRVTKRVYPTIPKVVKGDWVYPPTDINILMNDEADENINNNIETFDQGPPLSTAWFDSTRIHEKERTAMSEFFDINCNLRVPSTSLTTGSGLPISILREIIETRNYPKQYSGMTELFAKLKLSDVEQLSKDVDERYIRLRNTIIASYYAVQRSPKVYGESDTKIPIKLTFTSVRRSIPFDSGALLRLFKFLESEHLINYAHKRTGALVNSDGMELGIDKVTPFINASNQANCSSDGTNNLDEKNNSVTTTNNKGDNNDGVTSESKNEKNKNLDENMESRPTISTTPLNDATERVNNKTGGFNKPLFYQTDTSVAQAIRKFFIGDTKEEMGEDGAYDKVFTLKSQEQENYRKENENTATNEGKSDDSKDKIQDNREKLTSCASCGCDCEFYRWKSLTTPPISLCDDCYKTGEGSKVVANLGVSGTSEKEKEMPMKNVRFILVAGKEGEDWTTGETACLLKIIEEFSEEGKTWESVANELNNQLEKQHKDENMSSNTYRKRTPEECILRFLQIPEYDSLIDITLGRKPDSLSISGDTSMVPVSYAVPPGLHTFTKWNGESDDSFNGSKNVISVLSQLAERTSVEALNVAINASREYFKGKDTTSTTVKDEKNEKVANPRGSVVGSLSGSENTMASVAGVLGARIGEAEQRASDEENKALKLLVEALSHKIHILEQRINEGI